MKFARFVFIGAGIWGLAVLLPLYGLIDVTGAGTRPRHSTRSSSLDLSPSRSPGRSRFS